MSKPPEPRPSSRAWTFTTTSSPTSTGPVRRGYARRVARPSRRVFDVRGLRNLDKSERDVDHPLEVGDCDVLVRRMDCGHPVGEVHAGPAAFVEHVRVGAPAAQSEPRLEA